MLIAQIALGLILAWVAIAFLPEILFLLTKLGIFLIGVCVPTFGVAALLIIAQAPVIIMAGLSVFTFIGCAQFISYKLR